MAELIIVLCSALPHYGCRKRDIGWDGGCTPSFIRPVVKQNGHKISFSFEQNVVQTESDRSLSFPLTWVHKAYYPCDVDAT